MPAKPPTKAIGYIRVSTTDQAIEGVSIAAQREKIAAYCDLHGLVLADTFADEGLSGKRADNRPALQDALDAVCRVRGVLVVYSLSRLARSTMDCITIVKQLERCGGELASIAEKIDTTSSMGRFFFRLMASLGELEREQIGERTTAAMSHKRRQNERISRWAPYGWDFTRTGDMKPNADEQTTLESILRWRERDGTGYRKIAARLNEVGIKPKRGKLWHPSSVKAVLVRAGKV